MRYILKIKAAIIVLFLLISVPSFAGVKKGVFLNPITDVAWHEIFPIKIGGLTIIGGSGYDVADVSSMVLCVCPITFPPWFRVGITVSFWEPARMVEVVHTPYYFPFIGQSIGSSGAFLSGANSGQNPVSVDQSSFKQAHYLIFPVWSMLEILTDAICVEGGGLDVAYITEVDPMWQDDELTAIIQPEALLFANPVAQMSCVADSVSVNAYRPLDPLFWCMGSGGSAYPLTGHVNDSKPVQAAFSVANRMIYKLGRMLLLCDTNVNICRCIPTPIWVKSNYKFQAARPVVKRKAWPIGKSTFFHGIAQNPPFWGTKGPGDEFLYLIFRKRACCMF